MRAHITDNANLDEKRETQDSISSVIPGSIVLPGTTAIVPRRPRAFAVRTAALIRRGIRDIGRESNWLEKRVFSGRRACTAVSASGKVSVFLGTGNSGTLRLAIYDLDSQIAADSLAEPIAKHDNPSDPVSSLAWSPTGRILLAASKMSANQLQIFDAATKTHLDTFNVPDLPNAAFAWSPDGNLFSAAFAVDRTLRVWNCDSELPALASIPIGSLDVTPSLAAVAIGDSTADDVVFAGFGPMAFDPDGTQVALALKCAGDWADDFLLVAAMPSMRRNLFVPVHGNITAITWSADGRTLIYCAGGRAFAVPEGSLEACPLPFTAELARCHPTRPICACYSSWLKNASKGRLFIADLREGRILDEHSAEGVVDICWSYDTQQAYAVTHDGLAYVFERTLG
jgi:WD40 repeat protein